ncbi:MAG: DUF4080 domain-containing protein [Lachnospiraceae bacterium]|nr:DUF4080 domain-containing protein [Lachnospiraceae bacterium]
MKILLTAINAKYIHSNLAVYSLYAYAKRLCQHLAVAEYTINHSLDFVMQEIFRQRPDVLCFSCYIWNITFVEELSRELHKLLPGMPIWVGGPEVSYECDAFLQRNPQITGILRGEGEQSFYGLCCHYAEGSVELSGIPGLVYRQEGLSAAEEPAGMAEEPAGMAENLQAAAELVHTPDAEPLPMDSLPFCYEDLAGLKNRIVYYETSRGCPFRCSYCLSSLEKSLRLRSMSLVERELQFFLDHRVPQVKLVDRTFNCSHAHAMAIWQYLADHDNGVTNFHFEISADLLNEEELRLLGQMRPGLVQLEIGVQSTNPDTLAEIRRTTDLCRLEENAARIRSFGNIHQHLDLIAGLPMEGYDSFRASFDQVYGMHPQQLQLGFLKVLKGSWLYENRERYGILFRHRPPYEVLATRWLSYEELLRIKLVEEMLEVYGNSGQYEVTLKLLEQEFESPFDIFLKVGYYYQEKGLLWKQHSRLGRCEILLRFLEQECSWADLSLYQEALTFDLYYRENMKSRPPWATDPALWRAQARSVQRKGENAHLEPFSYDFFGFLQGQSARPKKQEGWQLYRFSYEERDPLTRQARVEPVMGQFTEGRGETSC